LHENGFLTHAHLADQGAKAYARIMDLGIDQCTFDDFSILNKEL